ncbi:minor tail protein [Mycobacterium phage Piro94]|uniref:Minor tail subunit n=1 Tax=Mycobacterium phage Piro94 TaxID=1527520 RepID=A0A076YJB5_9CAUD|nr:minor tail protein [Mycobacterium phage Piro94]AIK67747.1 minor tail subunit [Mycobacterium phage Piro94]AMB18520.1 minor tail protein [Mycobacterium phage NaSiaTalie]AOZ63975.1 minor tail protein [Mycobacterium phage Baehexic]
MTPFNPDSWMDVIALAIISAFSLAGVVAPVLLSSHRKQNKTLETVREHVANSHKTNLRDDIDEINRSLQAGFCEIRRDIGGLREELRTERIERIEGDKLRVVYSNASGG